MRFHSRIMKAIKKLEKELNETSNLKRTFPEFPISIEFPSWISRNGWGIFYQKLRGFRIWGPNHYTRASLASSITPTVCNPGNETTNLDPVIRGTSGNVRYWNLKVGNGTGATQKQDTALRASTVYQADSGTSARVDVGSQYYQRQYSAVYNAGTLPSGYTIYEVGLFMRAVDNTTISGQSFTSGVEYLVARLSTSDGDFNPYTVNNTIPLTINWIIQWSL
ncbi:MAG: hypothetical protein QXE51_04035 [Nitrososphaeria archaeon]